MGRRLVWFWLLFYIDLRAHVLLANRPSLPTQAADSDRVPAIAPPDEEVQDTFS